MDLTDDGMCFGCGKNNPIGLKLEFDVDEENLTVEGRFTALKEHAGYTGIMHGGLVATLLDEAMVKLVWDLGISAVTASLEVRLIKPVPVCRELVIKGRMDSQQGRMIYTSAEVEDVDGNVLARGKAKCMRVEIKEGYVGR
jgi:acyl-coenzyme A thioesterase PaaI-like protein